MKNKIYIVLILLLSFIFIGEVKADTCEITSYNSNWTNNTSFNIGVNPGIQTINKTFVNSISVSTEYDYFKIPLYVVSVSNNNQISNINLYESCTNATNVFDRYTITYQDGSTADIDAENYRTICNQYNTNGSMVLPYQPYIQNVAFRLLYNNSSYLNCEVDSNLMATCRIPKNINEFVINAYALNVTIGGNSTVIQGGIASSYPSYCKESETQIIEQQQQTNTKLDNIDTSINSSNTSGGESAADDLKNNSAFQDNSGLSSVVSMPLTFVNSLSNTCQPISINIPYFDVDMQIPCFQSIITEKMPALANLIKIVINGFIIYRVLLDIFQIIRNAKNPEDDRIEVLDL